MSKKLLLGVALTGVLCCQQVFAHCQEGVEHASDTKSAAKADTGDKPTGDAKSDMGTKPVSAETGKHLSAADKANRMVAIINKQELSLSKYVEKDEQRRNFCNGFFEDFMQQKNIEYITPVLETDDIEHPKLAHYGKCHGYDGWPPGIANSYEAFHNLLQIGDFNYKLYRLDLDGNPVNGPEELIYSEFSTENLRLGANYGYWGGYRQIDLDNCVFKHGKSIQQGNKKSSAGEFYVENYNLLLAYKDRKFVLDLYDTKAKKDWAEKYLMSLEEISYKNKDKMKCDWVYKNFYIHFKK